MNSTCLATVVIPVYNGAEDHLGETLAATLNQNLADPFEVLAIDSGSTDDSVEILRSFAAEHSNLRVIEIPNSEFSHGGTRQWAATLANGEYVVYLSQDAVPADADWLSKMLAGFNVADNVAGVLGRQKPRPDCFPAQKLEIDRAFGSQGLPDKYTVFDAKFPNQKFARFYSDVCSAAPGELLLGPLPYRTVSYSEDQAFGIDLIEGGYQKVFAGPAVVIHSNDVRLRDYARRIFDECKGLEKAGVNLGRPGLRKLVRSLFVEAPYDAARAYFDKEYSFKEKLYFIVTSPLYRFARWYGQLRASLGSRNYSLERKEKWATSYESGSSNNKYPHSPATSGYSQRVSAVIAALQAAGHSVKAVSIKPLASDDFDLTGLPIGHNYSARFTAFSTFIQTPSISLAKWISPRACSTLDAIARQWQPEVVVLESSYLAPYSGLFSCPIVFDLHNIESQLIGNYAKDRTGVIGQAASLESRLLERLEASIPQRAFGVATVSEADRVTFSKLVRKNQRHFPNRHREAPELGPTRLVAAPNGVNDAAFAVPDGLATTDAPTAVFIGHLGWRPNIDGAKWLANHVWPFVHAALPEAKLQLIGRDPHPSVTELANPAAKVTVHSNVASVFPFLSGAAVATAPLWTAGGTRLKILEALGTGTPVVATSLGALGLENLAADRVLQICDSPRDFAAALIKYLSAPAKSVDARNAAKTYRWSNTLNSLVELVNDAVD